MSDEELYEMVRDNYVKCNKEYLEEQMKICKEEIAKLEAKKTKIITVKKHPNFI